MLKTYKLKSVLIILGVLILVGGAWYWQSQIDTSLSKAKLEAQDARIVAAVVQLRTQAEIYFDKDSSYIGVDDFDRDPEIKNIVESVIVAGRQIKWGIITQNSYVAWSSLVSEPGLFYCADSTGAVCKLNREPQGGQGKAAICGCPTEEQTSNWQTYRNEKYGFEMKYPQSWVELKPSEPDYVIFRNLDEKSNFDYWFNVQVLEWFYKDNKKDGNLNDRFEEEKNIRKTEKDYKEITIAGQRAINYTADPTPQSPGNIVYDFVKDGKGYIITILYGKKSDGVGEKILSTFKFISQ